MALSNAERQKRYRDRQRGGPPRKKNPAGDFLSRWATMGGRSRAYVAMIKWIGQHAPDAGSRISNGKHRDGTGLRPTYQKLRCEYERVAAGALYSATAEQLSGDGWRLEIAREDEQFVARWVQLT